MSFAEPLWLVATLVAAGAMLSFWRRADRRRRADLARFASLDLLPDLTAAVSPRRRATKRGLLLAALALGGAALAGPRWGFTWEETQRRGIDVLIAIDVSRSMLAQDVAPSRLERAKLAIIDLVGKLGGDRVGLIAFAGSAFLQCPLTLDHGAFLDALHALQPGVIPAPGSDLASALRTAQEALATEKRNVKLLVLFSDGEDLGGGAIAEAKATAEQGIHVYTVGVGSAAGELIPLPKDGGGTEFLKGPDGQFVKSRLDAETLERVAEITGGFYEPLGQRGEGVDAVWERALAPLPKEDLASRMRRVPVARFQWPLAAALLLLAIEPWVRERRAARRAATAAALLCLLCCAPAAAHAASPAEAQRLYDAGRFDEALAAYRAAAEGGADDPRLDFNVGAAAYRAGAYGDAAQAFARALRSAEPGVQEQSFYNLGNAQFRAGEATRDADPQQTLAAWQQAIDAYDGALEIDPEDEDARFNRDFVKRELERLQQEQQQQQQDQDSDQEQQQREQEQKDEQQQSGQEQQGDGRQENEPRGDEQQQAQGDEQSADDAENEQQPGERQDEAQDPAKRDPQDASGAQDDDAQQARDGQPEPRDGTPPAGDERAGAPPPRPGQMSAAEAQALLDSLEGDETSVPALQASQQAPRSMDPERDW